MAVTMLIAKGTLLSSLNSMYIDGCWVAPDGDSLGVVNPATAKEVGRVPVATAEQLDRALESGQRGFESWSDMGAWTRSSHLREVSSAIRRRLPAIARTLTEEQGKPLAEAEAEVSMAADYFDWFADEARRIYGRTVPARNPDTRIQVTRHPVGPVAAFTAWNFPAVLPARKIGAALAAGCSVIVKPAEEAPRTALWLAQACDEAGIPPGVVNIVTGDPKAISAHLIRSSVIRKVSLTGSLTVGREVLRECAEVAKPASMELGGHAPVIVMADADLERAAEAAVAAKFRNAGQVCISPSRFYVEQSIMEEFAHYLAERTDALKVGNGMDPTTDIGPLANERRLNEVEALVQDAVERGAVVRSGGRRLGSQSGYFFEPTILAEARPEMKVMTDEPFGPLAPLASFVELDDAIQAANATQFGLAAYVFTRDVNAVLYATERIAAGMVGVNGFGIATPEAPFGGINDSGFGREGGIEGVDDFCVTKYTNITL